MKKKREVLFPYGDEIRLNFRKMKLTVILLFIVCVTFGNSFSQVRLSVSFNKTDIREVLQTIEEKTDYIFLYKDQIFNFSQKISANFKDAKFDEILKSICEQTNVSFEVRDRQIILKEKEASEVQQGQQQKSVSGKVIDSSGGALPGVTVLVKGTTSGTITDANGNYVLSNVPENATLQFSFVGMRTQEVSIKGRVSVSISLIEETVGIDEVVAVGYGTQKKGNLSGSISSIKSDQLTIAPVASTSNALAGRLPGLIVQQASGQPGYDAANLSIRGFNNALVIVDGIESDFNNIDANQIESISILKDGSASIYGARAGNGVILVTTKRGADGKPIITLENTTTYQGITSMPKMMSAGQFAETRREAWLNQGKPESSAPYTADEVQKYYNGTDPQYPNTDWYKELIRPWAPQQHNNISIKGGSEKIKYYGFLGYMNQESIWRHNGGSYDRFNLQSNIDAKILDNLSLQLDVASSVENRKTPYRDNLAKNGGSSVWGQFFGTWPIFPAHFPDPNKIPYTFGMANTITNRDYSYSNTDFDNYRGTISLNYNVKQIKGLSAKVFANYMQIYGENKSFSKPVLVYTYDYSSKTYSQAGGSGNASLNLYRTKSKVFTKQFSLNYDRTFNDVHKLTVLALYETVDYKNDSIAAGRTNFISSAVEQLFAGSTVGATNYGLEKEMGRKSYVGRANYSYKNKYLVEAIMRADASAKFSSGSRWGYFPSISLGWRVTQEPFMKKYTSLDDLKLRLSYGSSGNDNIGNFQYLAGYELGSNYIIGGGVQKGITSKGVANPDLTWEEIKIYNGGLDFSIKQRKLYGSFDVFYRERNGMLATRAVSLPSTFGSKLPLENLNSQNNRGFELNVGTSGKLSELKYDVSFNLSWSRSKWGHYEEPTYTDPDQIRLYTVSGTWTDRTFGYVAEGLFSSQDEINSLGYDQDLQGNISLKPGDIKYKDTNGDKKLDWRDQVEIGKGTIPHWMTGVNINLDYKNFDFSALFQGAFGYYTNVKLPDLSETYYQLRWTSQNNNINALIPRLGGAATNNLFSTYSYKKAGYLRLKNASLGYNLSGRLLQKININKVRLYLAGTNMLTFDKLKKYDIDPEAPSGNGGLYYPQQRTFSLGAIISL